MRLASGRSPELRRSLGGALRQPFADFTSTLMTEGLSELMRLRSCMPRARGATSPRRCLSTK